jgi:hypothetical protein
MLAGQVPAQHVVDRDRAPVVLAGAAVHQDHGRAALDELLQPRIPAVVHRRDEYASTRCSSTSRGDAAPAGVVTAAADHNGEAALFGDSFRSSDNVGEERVGHIEHEDGDHAAAAGPQLPGGVVADVPERLDGVEHALAGGGGNDVGPVQHVAHRADRNAGLARDLLDARRRHGSSART